MSKSSLPTTLTTGQLTTTSHNCFLIQPLSHPSNSQAIFIPNQKKAPLDAIEVRVDLDILAFAENQFFPKTFDQKNHSMSVRISKTPPLTSA